MQLQLRRATRNDDDELWPTSVALEFASRANLFMAKTASSAGERRLGAQRAAVASWPRFHAAAELEPTIQSSCSANDSARVARPNLARPLVASPSHFHSRLPAVFSPNSSGDASSNEPTTRATKAKSLGGRVAAPGCARPAYAGGRPLAPAQFNWPPKANNWSRRALNPRAGARPRREGSGPERGRGSGEQISISGPRWSREPRAPSPAASHQSRVRPPCSAIEWR